MPGLGPRQTMAATRLGLDMREVARKLRGFVGRGYSVTTERRIEQGAHGGLVLARKIFDKMREGGITIALMYGELGAGKSAYALHTAYELLSHYLHKRMGEDRNQYYTNIMLEYLVFTVPELIARIKKASWQKRLPVLIWDDAGVHGSSLLFFTNRKAYQALSAIVQTIRTRTASLLITAPLPNMIARQVRSLPETLVILVERIGRWESRALGFIQKQGPRRQYYSLAFVDYFNKRLPDRFYKLYMEKRDSYVQAGIEMYEALVHEEQQRKQRPR